MTSFSQKISEANSYGRLAVQLSDLNDPNNPYDDPQLLPNLSVTVGWFGGCRVSLLPNSSQGVHLDQIAQKLDDIHKVGKINLLNLVDYRIYETRTLHVLIKKLDQRATKALAECHVVWRIITFVRVWILIHLFKFDPKRIIDNFIEDFSLGSVIRDFSQHVFELERDKKSHASIANTPRGNFDALCCYGRQAYVRNTYSTLHLEPNRERLTRDIAKVKHSIQLYFSFVRDFYSLGISYVALEVREFFVDNLPQGVISDDILEKDPVARKVYVARLFKDKNFDLMVKDKYVAQCDRYEFSSYTSVYRWSQREISEFEHRLQQANNTVLAMARTGTL